MAAESLTIIDAHVHYSTIQLFVDTARSVSGVGYSRQGLEQEMAANGVTAAVGMGLTETAPGRFPDAASASLMGLDLAPLPANLYSCLGVNPHALTKQTGKALQASMEGQLQNPTVVGLKLYPGYYHYPANHAVYDRIFGLAGDCGLPVVIHGGDTASARAVLRLAHPLYISDLAVRYPEIPIVIAHAGNPWVLDVGVMLTNYENIYADLSGLILGDAAAIEDFVANRRLMDSIQTGLDYSGRFDKLLFGTDWPLVPMGPYVEFVKRLVPKTFWPHVFGRTAQRVFTRLQP